MFDLVDQRSCPLCGSSARRLQRTDVLDADYGTTDQRFTYVRCSSCDLVYLDRRPRADELSRAYPDSYAQHASSMDAVGPKALVQRLRKRAIVEPRMRRLADRIGLGEAPRVLDVGCGNGHNLEALKRLRPRGEYHGYDQAPAQAAHLAKQGIVFHAGDIEEQSFGHEAFDLVVLSHSIEHFVDPVAVLKQCVRALAAHGTIYIETHVADCLEERAFGPSWIGYDAPRHLTVFTAGSLRRLLQEVGLVEEMFDDRALAVGDVVYSAHRWLRTRNGGSVLSVLCTDRNPALMSVSWAANLVRAQWTTTSVACVVARKSAAEGGRWTSAAA